jgi:hypothetical protein
VSTRPCHTCVMTVSSEIGQTESRKRESKRYVSARYVCMHLRGLADSLCVSSDRVLVRDMGRGRDMAKVGCERQEWLSKVVATRVKWKSGCKVKGGSSQEGVVSMSWPRQRDGRLLIFVPPRSAPIFLRSVFGCGDPGGETKLLAVATQVETRSKDEIERNGNKQIIAESGPAESHR